MFKNTIVLLDGVLGNRLRGERVLILRMYSNFFQKWL
jgi:hypothetical protein